MPNLLSGIAATDDLHPDLARKSFAAAYLRLMPNGSAPIFAVASNMKTKTAVQVEHGYFTKSMVFPSFTVTAPAAAAAATLTVDSTINVLPGMTFQNVLTNEIILILSVDSATQVTVRRAAGTTAAAAITAASFFPQVGNAFEEGSNRPASATIPATRVTNLTQIFRNSWAVTDSMRATLTIAGDGNVAESRMDCMNFHAADIEKAIIFGEKYSGVLNNRPIRSMDGIISAVRTHAPGNIAVAGATTNYTQLENMLDPLFNFQSDPKSATERWLFVGGQALRVINKIGRLSGQYQIVNGETSFGLQFSSFKIARGTFRMVEHPLLNSNTTWAKLALGVDFSSLSLAYLGNRKTKSEEFGVDGKYVEQGQDSVGGSLTTETTLEMMNPFTCGVVNNLTDGAAG